jgi:D-beta-D-heptose 7-phosphate kinase/D-beta-D-heptose 1-phosphate adenosyltransferase
VLAALGCIDHLISFDEDTPCNLVRAIRPDVFVKGGDYTRDRLPEAAIVESYGVVVQILPLVQDRSTTGIIERIHQADKETRRGESSSVSLSPCLPVSLSSPGGAR